MTNVIELLYILDNTFGTHKPQGNNEFLFPCYFCNHHKPKLAVNIETGNWHCWVCNARGKTLFSLLKKAGADRARLRELSKVLGEYTPFLTEDKSEEQLLTLPLEFLPLYKPSKNYEYRHAIHYLKKRKISNYDIIKYNIGICYEGKYSNRIIIPNYDENGQLNFFTGRSYRDDYFPYKNSPVSKDIVGFESLISWNFPVILCEGVMDAITIRRNAIPLYGKTLPQALLYKILDRGVGKIYLALDRDAQKDSLRIAKVLMDERLDVFIVDLHDKDPNSIGYDGMVQCISNSTKLTQGQFMRLTCLK